MAIEQGSKEEQEEESSTYGCIHAVVAFHVSMLAGAMVGFAKRDTWHAAGDGA